MILIITVILTIIFSLFYDLPSLRKLQRKAFILYIICFLIGSLFIILYVANAPIPTIIEVMTKIVQPINKLVPF